VTAVSKKRVLWLGENPIGFIIFMKIIRNCRYRGTAPAAGAGATLPEFPRALSYPMSSMKIVLFRYDARIVTPLSLSYYKYRTSNGASCAADRGTTKKISLPAVSRRGPEAGVLHI